MSDILRLRLGPTKLGADDYFLYRLWDDARYSFDAKREFVGWRLSRELDRCLNENASRKYANDKLEFARAMRAAGLATPEIRAIYSERSPGLEGAVLLSDRAQSTAFLQDSGLYPVFMKPVHGTYGRGGFSALSWDAPTQRIVLGDGSSKSPAQVAEDFTQVWAHGYIVQELLRPHPEVVAVVGERLSSLRVIVLLIAGEPRVFRAVWKLPTGRNMSDNFMHGELGNLIANIVIQTGRIDSAVGMRNGRTEAIPQHPDTAVALTNLKVPLWDEVTEYCKKAAQLFPGLRMQHWDIALTPDGPVALEVNVEGSMDLHQLAGGGGVYNATLKSLQQEHGS
ncbi:MAG: hypothetical protein KDI01_01250 [Halioglobus sp.]|nr:hypothetical protein [Halioglobus sp.]